MEKTVVLLVVLLSFVLSACSSEAKTNWVKMNGDEVVFHDWTGKLIKTINLKTKRFIYEDKLQEYFEVIKSGKYERFVNALPNRAEKTSFENNEPVSKSYSEYEYNGLGLMKSQSHYSQEHFLRVQITSEYNNLGQEIKSVTYDNLQGITSTSTYSYEYNSDGSVAKRHYWEKEQEKLKFTDIYEYDKNKRMIRMKSDSPEKIAWSWDDYHYDNKGRPP